MAIKNHMTQEARMTRQQAEDFSEVTGGNIGTCLVCGAIVNDGDGCACADNTAMNELDEPEETTP